jgi:hypothetical protein
MRDESMCGLKVQGMALDWTRLMLRDDVTSRKAAASL